MNIIKEKNKVYIEENNITLAYVTFPNIDENTVEIDHTVVDPSLRGQGIASILLENAYNVIKEEGFKAVPTCSYAVSWFNKHEDKQDILKK